MSGPDLEPDPEVPDLDPHHCKYDYYLVPVRIYKGKCTSRRVQNILTGSEY
jgi:hypothetical protein